jgi:hypothetical protein
MKKLTFALLGLAAFASASVAAPVNDPISGSLTVTLVNQLTTSADFVAYDNAFTGSYIVDDLVAGSSTDTVDIGFVAFSKYGYSIKAYVGTVVYSDSSCQGKLNPWTGAGVLPCTAVLANNGYKTTLTCIPQTYYRK